MNLYRLVLATVSTFLLGLAFYPVPQSWGQFQTERVQQQIQAITLEIDAATLKSPWWLRINTTNSTFIKGQITLNGKVIRSLTKTNAPINIAPYLKVGINKIIISGKYYPANVSIIIELNASETEITQQTGGNGLLNQLLILEVK
ncbi:hypothetical protein C7H19_10950 [Aphanothece hegewaldii CCALA 016]|uniref:Uncharacterized protein n=2 Tax=Aphanothece TaxID=1121 RepID=A0A2T1LXZ5_9CHRO|nr:hypothetical protein C7H19_10950 [Aphanothece hegewaldii CCALA 016]